MIPWFLALLLCVASLAVGMIIAAKTIRDKEIEVVNAALEAAGRAVERVAVLARQHMVMHAALAGVIKEHGPQSFPKALLDTEDVPSLSYEEAGDTVVVSLS